MSDVKELPKRALVYLRVSTPGQADGESLQLQEERCRAYCAAKGWMVIEPPLSDEASASTLDRPDMEQLRAMLKYRKVDVLVIHKLDRLTRNIADLHTLLKELEQTRVSLVSVEESFDATTSHGRLLLNVLTSVASWERETIIERARSGLEKKRRDGKRYSRLVPFGFRDMNGSLVITDEMEWVRKMREWRKREFTLQQIADRLNKAGVKTSQGHQWYPASVRYVMLNRIYDLAAPHKRGRPPKNAWKRRADRTDGVNGRPRSEERHAIGGRDETLQAG